MTVEWEGEQIPLPRLNPFLQSPDRETREKAWRLQFQPYIEHRDEIGRRGGPLELVRGSVPDLEDVAPPAGPPFRDAGPPRAVLVLAVTGALDDDHLAVPPAPGHLQ